LFACLYQEEKGNNRGAVSDINDSNSSSDEPLTAEELIALQKVSFLLTLSLLEFV
jgi:hypothetical protein